MVKGSQRLALIGAPRTVDADGRPVSTTMEVVGGAIEIRVNHRDSDLRYPLLTDPEVWDDYRDASGRSWYQGGAMAPTSVRSGPNDKPADWYFHDFLNGWFIPATSCSPTYPDSCFGTGIGLHVYVYPGGNYYRNPYPNGKRAFGEWVYTIPGYNFDTPQSAEPSTYIAAASFQYQTLSCRGSNQALPYITEGIYAPYDNQGAGNWTGFSNIICGAANQPTTYTSTPGQNSAYIANPKPPAEQGKVAAFALGLEGPRSTQVDAYLGGAIMLLQDREAPTISAPSLLAWDKDRLAEVTATDAGLGMKEIRIEAPGLETQVEKTECSGTRSARPAENEPAGRCPRSLTAELTTDGLKDGTDTVTVTATDVTGKSSSQAVSVRTDRIVPQVNFSGSLSTARVLTDPSYSLSVAAQDAGAGTASGMRRVEIYIDGKLKTQQDVSCPGECPPGASASLEFASDPYPDGYHDVATRTVDEAGNDSWDGFRVLVARNGPLARATGELLTYADEALSSPEPLELEVGGADQLVGVKSIGVARIVPGGPEVTVASQDSGCTVTIICPKGRAATFRIDAALLPEGRQTLRAFSINAIDQRTTSASWTVTVDRTPPAVPGEPTLQDEADPVQVSVAPGTDPALPDGSPGSGVASIEYRYREDDGTLSEWEDIEVGQPLEVYRDPGESLALEYRAVDWANNRSASRNRTITVPGAEEEPTGGGPPDTTSRRTAFAAEGGDVDFPQQCLPAGEPMIWIGPPPPFTGSIQGFRAFNGSGGDRTDSVDSKLQSQKNLPDCRELPIASPTVPRVQDATPIVPTKTLGKYDLKAPTAYSAFRRLPLPFEPKDREFHPLYDSLGNKFAQLRQPNRPDGPWTVANEAGKAGPAIPGTGKTIGILTGGLVEFKVQGRACYKGRNRSSFVMISLKASKSTDNRNLTNIRGFMKLSALDPDLKKVLYKREANGQYPKDSQGRNIKRRLGTNAEVADLYNTGCRNRDVRINEVRPVIRKDGDRKGYDDVPADAMAISQPPNGWPSYFPRRYAYQGTGEAGDDPGYPDYANYGGYPSREPLFEGSKDQNADLIPGTPRVVPLLSSTTAVHGGGIVRAIVPNPRIAMKPHAFSTYASFGYRDPNGGCRPNDAFNMKIRFSERDGQRRITRDRSVVKWYLLKTDGIFGFVPVKDSDPYPVNAACDEGDFQPPPP